MLLCTIYYRDGPHIMNTIIRIIFCILVLLLVCASTIATAHNKVVVIPMFDDSTAKPPPPAPVPEISQPWGEYFVYSNRVLDEVTNLLWQRSSGPAHARYTWQEAWEYCKFLDINGVKSWRLPEPYELITIVDYTKRAPAISVNAFSDTSNVQPYWTNQRRSVGATIIGFNYALVIDFYEGGLQYQPVSDRAEVRCVQGDILPSGQALRDNLNGTASDLVTGLTWQQSTNEMIWQDANNYCENLHLGGKQNWRLPTIKELTSINSYGNRRLTQHRVFREHPTGLTSGGYYWSSHHNISHTIQYWAGFGIGEILSRERDLITGFRCVSD